MVYNERNSFLSKLEHYYKKDIMNFILTITGDLKPQGETY